MLIIAVTDASMIYREDTIIYFIFSLPDFIILFYFDIYTINEYLT